MAATIILWDSDPVFRKALFRTLLGNGFNPVALENPANLSNAMELQRPELIILEGSWQQGSKINLGQEELKFCSDGELSLILPSFEVTPSGRMESGGIVLENLRKPFGLRELSSGIQSALRIKEHIERKPSPWAEYLEFRRLKTEEEVLSTLKLRYEVYQEVGFINSNNKEIEIDRYDPKSIIFGAFVHQNGTKELAGTVRIIQNSSDSPHKKELGDIMRQHGIECAAASDCQESTLPSFATFEISAEDFPGFCPEFGSTLSGSGKDVSSEICELSRLVIKREYRRHRFGIERKLYELVIVDCCVEEPERNWFVIAVHPSKSSKYAHYGFNEISVLGIKSYSGISQPAILMTWDLQQYLLSPNPFTENLDFNNLVYRVNGNIMSTLPERTYSLERQAS